MNDIRPQAAKRGPNLKKGRGIAPVAAETNDLEALVGHAPRELAIGSRKNGGLVAALAKPPGQ